MASAILRVRGLVMDFGGVRAVDNCSLNVDEGSITGLIGPNGAGKTTLFNLIAGFHKPTAGRVTFRNERIDGLPSYLVFRKGIVRTFQIPRELKRMSVLENLMLVPSNQAGESMWRAVAARWLVKRQERAIESQAREVLDFTGLTEVADLPAEGLSGGQKKLLELARTLMAKPQMVLLDEPGAGVNPTLLRRLVGGIPQGAGGARHNLPHHRTRHGPRDAAVRPRHRHERGRGAHAGDARRCAAGRTRRTRVPGGLTDAAPRCSRCAGRLRRHRNHPRRGHAR